MFNHICQPLVEFHTKLSLVYHQKVKSVLLCLGSNVDDILLKKATTEMQSKELVAKMHSLCVISRH
jgi:hypothetical protein